MEVTEAAKMLALSVKTYSRWVGESRAGTLMSVNAHRVLPVTDLQAEVSRLKRELAIACEDRDILKKATALLLEHVSSSHPAEICEDSESPQHRPPDAAKRRAAKTDAAHFFESL